MPKSETSGKRSRTLLVVHAEGVLDGLSSVAGHLGRLVEVALLACVAGASAAAGDGVSRLLADALLALCEIRSARACGDMV